MSYINALYGAMYSLAEKNNELNDENISLKNEIERLKAANEKLANGDFSTFKTNMRQLQDNFDRVSKENEWLKQLNRADVHLRDENERLRQEYNNIRDEDYYYKQFIHCVCQVFEYNQQLTLGRFKVIWLGCDMDKTMFKKFYGNLIK